MNRLEHRTITDRHIQLRIFPNFLTELEAYNLFEYIMKNVKFEHDHITKAGIFSKKRNKIQYGSIPYYIAKYQGREIRTPVINWDELPLLKSLAEQISLITKQTYHVCIIQLYNNGEVGIDPHRDKEMVHGTIITSLSLGTTRVMRFEYGRYGQIPDKTIDVALSRGTLCLIDPPTNDFWTHSIPKDSSTTARMSLIFRNCANMN